MNETLPNFPESDEIAPTPDAQQLADNEAMEYYQSGGGREVNRTHSGPERRSLQSRLDREIPVLTGMKMTSTGEETDESRLINYFQDFGPMSWQEGMSLYQGAAERVRRAADTKKGDPEAAIKDRYYTFSGYLLSASADMEALEDVLVYRADGEPHPNIARLRTSDAALEVIARHFMVRGFLWDKRGKYWPSKTSGLYKERHKYWRGFVLSAAKYASDESMAYLFDFAKSRTDKLLREWFGQMQQIEAMPQVRKLEAEDKLVPITFTRLWSHKARQLEIGPPLRDERRGEHRPTDYYAMLLPEIREEIEEQRRREEQLAQAAEAEMDREMEKAQQRLTPAEARKELQGKGIGHFLFRSERFEQEQQKEIEDISERARRPKLRKPRRRGRNGRNSPALRPWIRKQPGYDKRPPDDELTLF